MTASVNMITPLPAQAIVQSISQPKAESNSTSTIKSYIEEEAIKKGVDPKLATSISNCESGFIPRQSDCVTKEGKREDSWGVWQINLQHNPEVTREQAMDIKWSTEWSLNKLKQGKASLWSCYKK